MIAPYYQDDHVTLYHGDCREITEWLTGDVMVTDPPYGMAYVGNFGREATKRIAGDNDTSLRDAAIEAWGVRPALVFGIWRCPRPAATRHLLVWDKGAIPGNGDLSIPWGNSAEEVYVLGGGFVGRRRSNVIRCDRLSATSAEHPNHPTPKPLGLMRSLIEYCPPGVIVDPFCGSGSTLRAAKDLGRKAIGVELDERYCEIAAKRLGQEVLDFGGVA